MSRDMMRAVGGMGMMGKMKLMKHLMSRQSGRTRDAGGALD